MGRCDYSQMGYGMTEQEARRNANAEARDEHGHEDGYSGGMNSSTHEDDRSKCIVKPLPAKSCKVEKDVRKGARKWVTVFKIEPKWGFSDGNYNSRHHAEITTTQGDAIAKAKSMALEFNKEFTIDIDKRLENGSSRIASVAPKKSRQGKWLFTGTAKD
jgi:hypothetical protein